MVSPTDNKIYRLQYSDSFSGDIFVRVNNRLFVLLEHAFHQMFSNSLLNYNIALLTIGASIVAIFRPFPEVFKIFDSHSNMSMECLVHLEVVF